MNIATGTSPDDLRARMVARILGETPLSANVEAALRTVPRHRFLPEASLEDAYAAQAVTTKQGPARPLSCASHPTVVAQMLEQLDVRRGDHVLEIGAGTGYNAALLAELTGNSGQVTTIDIYPDVSEHAGQALTATGYRHVNVVCGDGSNGYADRSPYNRIIVTVGPWDIPPAWTDQLPQGGRLVIPLHWRGQAQSVAFVHHGTYLQSESMLLCGFIPMIGQSMERSGYLDPDGDVVVYCDNDQHIDLELLRGVLAQPATTTWSEVTVSATESFDRLWLQLTAAETGTCRIAAAPPAINTSLCAPAIPSRSPALIAGASIAYLGKRPDQPAAEARWELGAVGHGPDGAELAGRLVNHIRTWDIDRTREPLLRVYPNPVPQSSLPAGLVIGRPHNQLVVSA